MILRGSDAVLIDFDASRIVKPEHAADTVILGTTGYAAPEQFGLSPTGQHPSRQLAGGKAGHIVQKCTMMNPDQRYQSVQELRNAL